MYTIFDYTYPHPLSGPLIIELIIFQYKRASQTAFITITTPLILFSEKQNRRETAQTIANFRALRARQLEHVDVVAFQLPLRCSGS